MLSIGFFGLAVLTLIGLTISITRTDSKALERSAGTLIANQILGRTLAQLEADSPGGVRENFFGGEHVVTPWDTGQLTNDHTTFYYDVKVASVQNASGGAMGSAMNGNRLKRVDIHVWWAEQNAQTKQGYGRLEVFLTKLVSEGEVPLASH